MIYIHTNKCQFVEKESIAKQNAVFRLFYFTKLHRKHKRNRAFHLGGKNSTSLDFCSQWKKNKQRIYGFSYYNKNIYVLQSLLPHLQFRLLAKICVQTKIVLYLVDVEMCLYLVVHKPQTKWQSFCFIHIDLIILVLLVYFYKNQLSKDNSYLNNQSQLFCYFMAAVVCYWKPINTTWHDRMRKLLYWCLSCFRYIKSQP